VELKNISLPTIFASGFGLNELKWSFWNNNVCDWDDVFGVKP
jgi:hypothetical protein